MPYLVIAFFFGLAGGVVGRIKGSSFVLWFLISGILPVFGLLAAVLYRFDSEEPEYACPRCGKRVKIYDALCTRCGQELGFPETTEAPEIAAQH
jgi:DNA-directed RNA polymerase subunit RPC12/RpoP